jgi:hypothetical protein
MSDGRDQLRDAWFTASTAGRLAFIEELVPPEHWATDPTVAELREASTNLDVLKKSHGPQLAEMRALLDRPDIPLPEVLVIRDDADRMQRELTAARLRCERAAGSILSALRPAVADAATNRTRRRPPAQTPVPSN